MLFYQIKNDVLFLIYKGSKLCMLYMYKYKICIPIVKKYAIIL